MINVLKNLDRQRVQQWQAVGSDVVIGETLLETCIAELMHETAVAAEA